MRREMGRQRQARITHSAGEAAQEPKSLRFGTFAPFRCLNCLSQVERSHEPYRTLRLSPTCAGASFEYTSTMSLDQLKREVASLSSQEQAELISYALHLRYAGDPEYRREVTDRLNDSDKSHWLTPEEFERRLDNA